MFASNANRMVDWAIGGWTLSGTTTWESGRPFTPTYAECGADQDLDTNFGGPGVRSDCRPNSAGGGFYRSGGIARSGDSFAAVLCASSGD